MDFLLELLVEIVGEVLSAVVDFFTVKNKKPTQKRLE